MDDNIKIIIDSNAAETGQSFGELSEKISASTTEAGNLRQEIKSLRDSLLSMEQGTEEYNSTLAELSQKMHDLKDINEEVSQSTGELDVVLGNMYGVTTSLVSGISAVNGIFTMFGANSEDLQKTMVRLQSAMAIVQGLQGFEGIGKKIKNLGTSFTSFTQQIKLTTAATNAQTTSTVAMGTATVTTTAATNGLKTALNALKAAFASNPIGLIITGIAVAATALVTAINSLVRSNKEANEQIEETYKWVLKMNGEMRTVADAIEDQNDGWETYSARLKAAGASQERLNEERAKFLSTQNESIEAQTRDLMAFIKSNAAITKNKEKVQEAQKEYERLTLILKANRKELASLNDAMSFKPLDEFNRKFSALDKNLGRQVKSGSISEIKKYEKEIEAYVKQIDAYNKYIGKMNSEISSKQAELSKRFGRSHNPQNDPAYKALKEEIDNLIFEKSKYDFAVEQLAISKQGLEDMLDDAKFDAGLAKSLEGRKSKEELDKALDGIIETLNAKKDEIIDTYDTLSDDISRVLGFPEDVVKSYQLSASTFRKLWGSVNELEKEISKTAEGLSEGVKENFLTSAKAKLDSFKNDISDAVSITGEYAKLWEKVNMKMDDMFGSDLADAFPVQNYFKGVVAMLKELASAGILSADELNLELADSFGEIMPEFIGTVNGFRKKIANELKAGNLTDDEASLMNLIIDSWTQFDPDVLKAVEAGLTKSFEEIEKAAERASFIAAENLRTNGQPANVMEKVFGLDPTKAHDNAVEYINALYEGLKEANMAKQAELENLLSTLDQNTDAYATYYARLGELQREWVQLTNEQYDQVKEANKNQADGMISNFESVRSSMSSFTLAMGDFYEQLAGNYSEDDKEYKEYMKKSGQYKKAGIFMNAAMGIVSAWATAMELGPVAGPVIAALETATLIATAATQAAQIDKQLQSIGTSAGGGSSSANLNTGGIDRVVYGNYLSDDTNSYLQQNQDNRVYILESDITETQNRVRVTESDVTF